MAAAAASVAVALLALAGAGQAFYLPGVAPRTFRYGDRVRRPVGTGRRDRTEANPALSPGEGESSAWFAGCVRVCPCVGMPSSVPLGKPGAGSMENLCHGDALRAGGSRAEAMGPPPIIPARLMPPTCPPSRLPVLPACHTHDARPADGTGEQVELKVNKLTSVHTQLPTDYYGLKFCKPKHGVVRVPSQ